VLTAGLEDPGASVRLVVRNAAGQIVHEVEALAGHSASAGSVVLVPGLYTVESEVRNPNGVAISYRVRGTGLSDPMGPVLTNPTLRPRYDSPQNPGYFLYPGFRVPYDPSKLPGYVRPGVPSTYPPGFVLPPEYARLPWLIVTRADSVMIPLQP
jgi:hypothetical protein